MKSILKTFAAALVAASALTAVTAATATVARTAIDRFINREAVAVRK